MAPKHILKLIRDEKRKFLDSFNHVFSDCDGVLWTLIQPIKNVGPAIKLLEGAGKSVNFVTNNSIRSEKDYQAAFERAGIDTDLAQLVHPLKSIIYYLKKTAFEGPIYCIGSTVFKTTLNEAGYEVLDGPNHFVEEDFRMVLKHAFDQPPAKAVVIDVDFNLTAIKLIKAEQLVKSGNCIFISGATDERLPVGRYGEIIGPGPYIKILENATGKKATVLGKPGKALGEQILETYSITDPKKVLFVGDMLQQDVYFGKMCGFQTLLVLSGGTTHEQLMNTSDPNLIPDYYAESLGDFVEFFSDLECKTSL